MALSVLTVYATYYAPVGAAMPRVAVTALAYVGVGNTLNHLGTKLPTLPRPSWVEVLMLIQMVSAISTLYQVRIRC